MLHLSHRRGRLCLSVVLLTFLAGAARAGSNYRELALLGLLLFGAAALFQAVTLPVEYNASNRAMRLLVDNGLVTSYDAGMARQVLDAAALGDIERAVMKRDQPRPIRPRIEETFELVRSRLEASGVDKLAGGRAVLIVDLAVDVAGI
mgnify:CR=1 FL=1